MQQPCGCFCIESIVLFDFYFNFHGWLLFCSVFSALAPSGRFAPQLLNFNWSGDIRGLLGVFLGVVAMWTCVSVDTWISCLQPQLSVHWAALLCNLLFPDGCLKQFATLVRGERKFWLVLQQTRTKVSWASSVWRLEKSTCELPGWDISVDELWLGRNTTTAAES